jgi:rod shape-determining protein MreC
MESYFVRYRNILVLLAILVAQLIGLAMQVHRTGNGRNSLDPRDSSGVRLIRLWADAVILPPEQLFHVTKMGAVSVWQDYLDLRHTHEQNQDLQKTIDRLRLEQASLLEDAKQGKRLQTLMDFQQKYVYKTLAAQAIGTSGSDLSRIFYIDKGSSDGLQPDMAVITPDGIVGKVREVFPHSSQVLAINDPTSGAGVILETTRLRGILRGNAQGRPQIEGILSDQRIQPGEKVFTAGGDQIFPRGLPVGVVEKVVRDPERDSYIDVIVKPAAHLNQLDEVLVVTSIEPRFSPEEAQDLATSEELKGAEVEAIKEQQKASEIMAERLPGLTEPNAPAAAPAATPGAQPGQPSATPVLPAPPQAPKLMQPRHTDRFSPGAAPSAAPAASSEVKPKAHPQTPAAGAPGKQPAAKPASKTAAKPGQPASSATPHAERSSEP